MDMEKLNLIVLSALLHDVGKLLERGEHFSEARKDEHCLSMCPDSKEGRHKTHFHCVHTRAFCDWLEDKFDCLRSKKDKSWKDWCAAHHRNDETSLEATVIRIADRLSSSEREQGDYYQRYIHQRTLLEPVLERVHLGSNPATLASSFRYPLCSLSMDRKALFPQKGQDLGLKEQVDAQKGFSDPSKWEHLLAPKPLRDEYKRMGDALLSDVEALAESNPEIDLTDLIRSLDFILERHCLNVPSATNVRHPDISLYDHMRTTAAIAQSLYLHQVHNENSRTNNISEEQNAKWILACGDFSGIQSFIYNLTNKGAAKGLRGRSFYVQYFCLICAERILRDLGLNKSALIYNSGGKFFLLLPKYMQTELYQARDKINNWLLKQFAGSVYLGLGLADINAAMFSQGNMDKAWQESALDLEKDRLQKFLPLMDADFFEPQTVGDPGKSCQVCGNSRTQEETCSTCKLLQDLGIWLKDAQAIITVWNKQEAQRIGQVLNLEKRQLFLPDLEAYSLFVPDDKLLDLQSLNFHNGQCLYLNRYATSELKSLKLPKCAISGMFIGKWDARKLKTANKEPWNFEDFAHEATGIDRLGVLRMDVDNLGLVFIRGLQFPKRKGEGRLAGWGDVEKDESGKIVYKPMASLSRMVTLSRQLNMFFAAYVPLLLEREEFSKCQIIYTGGDDLFIIGSWNQLPYLAWTIRNEFSQFCCQNPDFTISGGMTLQRGKYPIYKGAKLTEEAEKASKEVRQIWNKNHSDLHKDGFCFQNVPLVWEDMPYAQYIKDMLIDDSEEKRGLLSYLSKTTASNKNKVNRLAERKGLEEPSAWQAIMYDAWRWRTTYQLKRRFSHPEQSETRRIWAEALFADKFEHGQAKLPVVSWLEFPLRWADFLQRAKGGK